MDRAERRGPFAVGNQPHFAILARLNEILQASAAYLLVLDRCPFGEQAVRRENTAAVVDNGRHDPGLAEPFAGNSLNAVRRGGQRIRDRGLGKTPQQEVALPADALDFDRAGSGVRGDAGDAAGAVAPGHRSREFQPLPGVLVSGQRQRRAIVPEPLAISGIHDQHRAFAAGQCRRFAAEGQRRSQEREVGSGDQRLLGQAGARGARIGPRRSCRPRQHRDCGQRHAVQQQQNHGRADRRSGDQSWREPSPPAVKAGRTNRGQLLVQHAGSILPAMPRPTRCGRASPASGTISGPGVMPNAWYQASKLRTMSRAERIGRVRIRQQARAEIGFAIIAPPYLRPARDRIADRR